ncbi:MAG: hypothetical protein ACT4QD_13650 [Acidobacteriota bacterium]
MTRPHDMARTVRAVLLMVGAASMALAQNPPVPTSFAGVLDEHPAIAYATRPTNDAVARLGQSLAQGTSSLAFQSTDGYLRSVLRALKVSDASQLLVFSKTGVQRASTGPHTPRAIYFNDSVAIGYIPGARTLELAAHDPQQGVVFYTLDQSPGTTPRFVRRTDCLTCHVSAGTLEVPGMIVRSQVMGTDGESLPQLGSYSVNHRTPLTQRWGGWYVTGNYTAPVYSGFGHLGNVTVAIHPSSGPATTSNEIFIRWLNSEPDRRGYLSAESDIAALMVFDHQMHAINLLTRLNWETRAAAADGRVDFEQGVLGDLAREVADYFLFVGEVPPVARVTPRPGFAETFAAGAPRDRRGRSLRELDLDRRLLRYPLSYLVYSAAFDGLPAHAKAALYRELWEALAGDPSRDRFSHLSAADRQAVIEILRDTRTDLPEFFRARAGAPAGPPQSSSRSPTSASASISTR